MDSQRLILFIALSLVLLLLWQAWQFDYGPRPPQAETAAAPAATPAASAVPALPQDVPPAAEAVPTLSDAPLQQPAAEPSTEAAGQTIRIVTDLLAVEINTAGGDLRKVDLLAYPVAVDQPENKFRLLNDTLPGLFVAQSGLVSRSVQLPDHHAVYSAERTEYRLADGADSLQVPLRWQNEQGVTVTKRLTFHRDSYLVDVEYLIENAGADSWPVSMYRQFQRTEQVSTGQSFIYTYTGGVVSTDANKYQKVEFADMASWRSEESYVKGGWAAMLQHYFIGAWLTAPDQVNRFYSNVVDGNRYVLGMMTAEQQIPAAGSLTLGARAYIGPKEQHRLERAAPNLRLTVDYGMLTVIAQPLYWLMENIQKLLSNWGWSIIVLTLLVKLAFYKLSETQYRSMAHMRRLQPKMEALKERFGDDRQKLGQAMMDLYKKEKINPLAGCLPIVVQIPVFIALYWVLVESVELRQADFIFWINDLSIKDPYFVLPVLMGISMFAMQKLSPTPADPIQAKVMMSLPFLFTVFFAFFPAGLVLYWLANNVLSIIQQWYITRNIEQAAAS